MAVDPARHAGTRTRSSTEVRLLAVLAVVAVAGALRLTRPVSLPLVAGLVIVALAWPLQRRLEERRLPRPLAYLLTVLAVLVVLGAVVAVLALALGALSQEAEQLPQRLRELWEAVAGWLRRHGLLGPGGGQGGGNDVVVGVAQRVATVAYGSLALLGLTLGFAALALVEVHAVRERLRHRMPRGSDVLELGAELAGMLRRYFLVKTATSALTGLTSALLALAIGLEHAFTWGVLAFLLEYVPTVGSVLAVLPPSLYAFLQYEGVVRPLGVLAAYTALQLVMGNFVDPRLEGHVMALSPTVVLLSIVFWAWVWGALGALLGVPLTMAVVVVCRRFPATDWVAVLLADEREPARQRP